MEKPLAKSNLRRQLPVLLPALVLLTWLLAGAPPLPWQYDPIVRSRGAIGAMAIALVLLTVLGPTFRPISSTRRTILSALRLAVVVLVVLFMLRPTCVTTNTTKQSAALLVLFDQSRSMTLPHQADQTSRWEAQLETLHRNESLLSALAKDLEVKVYAYDQRLLPVEFKDGVIQFPAKPDGDATDIGSPLYEAVAKERSNRLAGVILLGDGVQTVTGDSPRVEIWEAAEELARLDQPLYTIAFGPEGDVREARDVAIVNLPDQYSVFVKNELLVQGTLQIRGFRGLEIPVELLIEESNGERRVVATERVAVPTDDQQVEVRLSYTPQQAGQYRLTLRAVEQEGETVLKNNQLSAFLTVLSGGLRVLYLEGELRLEQKFLRRSLDASKDIELDFQWLDHRLRDRWPVNLADLLKNTQYDVFIIGDLDSRALYEKDKQEENLKALVEAVESGKGLIMLGGFHSFGPGRYGGTPLADVLPIEIDRFEAQDFGTPVRDDLHINQPLAMVPVAPHFLTRLASDVENERVWRALPPLDGANRFRRAKDRAQILLESPDGLPLLVAGQYGGRVLAFAGDTTWRWWMVGHSEEHRRFWRQVILWLSRRDDLVKDDVWIQLSQRRYDPGGRVEFTAGAKTAAGDVIQDAAFEAVLEMPGGERKAIPLVRTGQAQTGRFDDARQPGTYTIEVTATRGGTPLGTAEARFMIYDRDVELSIPEANHDQLARLAHQTKGRPIAPEELSELLHTIQQQPPQLQLEIPKTWQLGDTWQDAWLFFLAVVSLLSIEWVLRKRWGLV